MGSCGSNPREHELALDEIETRERTRSEINVGEQYTNPLAKPREARGRQAGKGGANANGKGNHFESGEAQSSTPAGKSRRPQEAAAGNEAAARLQASLDASKKENASLKAEMLQENARLKLADKALKATAAKLKLADKALKEQRDVAAKAKQANAKLQAKVNTLAEELAEARAVTRAAGHSTTGTGLSDSAVLGILGGDSDKDKTVVAKSIREQRAEASERAKKAELMLAKLLPGGRVPDHVQLFLDDKQFEGSGDDRKRAEAVEPAKWLLEVLKNSYLDDRLHAAGVSLLIQVRFTPRLGFLQQYDPLKKGLAAFVSEFGGAKMKTIFDEHDLGTLLTDAEVSGVLGRATGERSQVAMMGGLFDSLKFTTPIDRFVNEQVALHLVLMVSRAADPAFQAQIGAIASTFAQSKTGMRSGPVKQFPRPFKKALTDYAGAEHPRVCYNLDPIRALIPARDVQSMFRVMRALAAVFGPFPKWKNLFSLNERARASRDHLVSVMITVPFELKRTYGDLAQDPAVQDMWDAYCAAPEGVPLERWHRDTAAARKLLQSPRVAGMQVKIFGEVQLLLETFVAIRNEIHAAYEFLRAKTEAALHEEVVLTSGNYKAPADAGGLINAAMHGQRDVAARLVAAGAGVNEAEKATGATPANYASQNGHVDVVVLLAGMDADLNQAEKTGGTPVFAASQNGHAGVVEVLAANGADVNQAGNNGQTPVGIASWKGHAGVVEVLAANGADVNQADARGQTPVLMASADGHAGVVEVLVATGVDVNQADTRGQTPVFVASWQGHANVVKCLIAAKADINIKTPFGTALDYAVKEGHAEVIAVLKAAGAN